jgi:hypothetical protein
MNKFRIDDRVVCLRTNRLGTIAGIIDFERFNIGLSNLYKIAIDGNHGVEMYNEFWQIKYAPVLSNSEWKEIWDSNI